jgi:hypothetical protein
MSSALAWKNTMTLSFFPGRKRQQIYSSGLTFASNSEIYRLEKDYFSI